MRRKIDLRKPKEEIREGYESMVYYPQIDQTQDTYRFYFKGRVVKFKVAKRTHTEIDGVRGMRLDLITDSSRASIWYEAFERADGVVFFLGESETQSVSKETRTLAYRSLDRFN